MKKMRPSRVTPKLQGSGRPFWSRSEAIILLLTFRTDLSYHRRCLFSFPFLSLESITASISLIEICFFLFYLFIGSSYCTVLIHWYSFSRFLIVWQPWHKEHYLASSHVLSLPHNQGTPSTGAKTRESSISHHFTVPISPPTPHQGLWERILNLG